MKFEFWSKADEICENMQSQQTLGADEALLSFNVMLKLCSQSAKLFGICVVIEAERSVDQRKPFVGTQNA